MADHYISGTGLDSSPNDGSSGLPYRTPEKALQVASAGDRLLIERGYTYAGACLIALDNITVEVYGSGDRPILTNAAGNGIEIADGVVGTALTSLHSYGNGAHGLMLGEGITGTATDCVFSDNAVSGSNGVRTKTAGVGGTFEFVDCISRDNENDGFGTFGSFVMVCRNCVSHGNDGNAASDGFTNHDTSAMQLWFCEAYGNTRGVAFTSDNGAASSFQVGCYVHDNASYEYVTSANGGSGATVNKEYAVGCAFVSSDAAPTGTRIVRVNFSAKLELWNCTLHNPNTGATTTQSLDDATTGTGSVLWKNCRFTSANDNDARHVRTSSSPTTQVEGADFNHYDLDTGNKWNAPASTSFTSWKALTGIGGVALDLNSVQAADTQGVPFATKADLALPVGSSLRGIGTALPSYLTSAGLHYDLFETEIVSATPDIGAAQYAAPFGTGVGGGSTALSELSPTTL